MIVLTAIVPRRVVVDTPAEVSVIDTVVTKTRGTGLVVTRVEALRVAGIYDEDSDRLRNYELESRLNDWTKLDPRGDRTFVIGEWCPFNGLFCRWVHFAPLDFLRREIRSLRNIGRLKDPVLIHQRRSAAQYIEGALKER